MRKLKDIYFRLKSRIKRIGLINILWIYLKKIRYGYVVYKRILDKYGKDTQIYIEHYPGTGDIYITCALLESYRQKCGDNRPYVVTIIGEGSAKIVRLLGIDHVELLSQDESDLLITFYRFVGNVIPNITILHYAPIAMHTRITDSLAGYNELDFMSMYLATVFPGVTWEDAVHFPDVAGDGEIREYFDEKGLVPGKTVVLFPFANTIEHLPWHLWEELARRLRERGFSVCTNVEPGGPVVPGTSGIFVPYHHLREFVNQAGFVVGLRSGIFDIIADTECTKFVLYPTPNVYKFGVGTIFDYFSLLKMGLCGNVIEYEFERIYAREAFAVLYGDICAVANEVPLLTKRQFRESTEAFSMNHVHRYQGKGEVEYSQTFSVGPTNNK